MPVYPNGGRFTRRFLTRFRGGFSILELTIASVLALIGYALSGSQLFIPPVVWVLSLGAAWHLRRLPTDERRLSKWVRDMISYFRRTSPLRPRHVRALSFAKPKPHTHPGGVVHILGKKGGTL